jgi:outer membrane lipoprotein SlyB
MNMSQTPQAAGKWVGRASPFLAVLMLGACVEQPVRTVAVAPPPPPPKLFVYPAQGQSPDQTAKDQYECHVWAVQQTGVDPSQPGTPPGERVVVAPPPGTATVTGAIGGAILGSIIAGPRAAGAGALFGGATGAIVGSSVDASNQAQAAQAQHEINQSVAAQHAAAQSYRRAMSVCLQGRGYTVS